MTSRRTWYAAAALVALGGVLLMAAAAVRWWPCLADDDSPACLVRESRTWDYLVPVDPAQPQPATAVLAGLALLLVAAGLGLLARRMSVGPARRAALTAVLAAKPAGLGLLILAAPVIGVLPRAASPVVLIVEIGLDVAVLLLAVTTSNHRLADYQRLLVGAVAAWLVGWVGRVLDALVFGLLAADAAVPPGSGLLTGVLVLVCGGGIAALTVTAPERALPTRAAGDPLERPTHG